MTPEDVYAEAILAEAEAQDCQGDVRTVTLPLEEYLALVEADEFLTALYAAGVDNWEGYGEAQRIFQENDEE